MELYDLFRAYQEFFIEYKTYIEATTPDASYKEFIIDLLVKFESPDRKKRQEAWSIYNKFDEVDKLKFREHLVNLYSFENDDVGVFLYKEAESEYPVLIKEIDRDNIEQHFPEQQTEKSSNLLARLFPDMPISVNKEGEFFVIPCFSAFVKKDDFTSPPNDTDIVKIPEYAFAITLPDMHGNILKFIRPLLLAGILTCSYEVYEKLKLNLVTQLTLNENDYKFQKDAIPKIKATRSKDKVFIRLLGDMLADRCGKCFDILLMLEHLDKLAEIEIIASNHDMLFCQYMMAEHNDKLAMIKDIFAGKDQYNAYRSLINYHKLIYLNSDLPKIHEEINSIYKDKYLPKFKLLSYEIKDNGEMIIFSHAPCTLTAIINAAKSLNVETEIISAAEDLLKEKSLSKITSVIKVLIDRVNEKFSEKLQGNKFKPEEYYEGPIAELFSATYVTVNPLDYQVIMAGISNIHGHIGGEKLNMDTKATSMEKEKIKEKFINLDNNDGKVPEDMKGTMSFYISRYPEDLEQQWLLTNMNDLHTASENSSLSEVVRCKFL